MLSLTAGMLVLTVTFLNIPFVTSVIEFGRSIFNICYRIGNNISFEVQIEKLLFFIFSFEIS